MILGIRGVPAAHGGFETFAERLVVYLRDRGWTITVYCQGSASGLREEDEWKGVRRVHIPVSLDGSLGTIEFDARSTDDALKQRGVLLTLGYNTGFLSSWVSLRRRANVINMDGLEWKRDKYGGGARIYLWLNERLAAYAGTTLIADHPVIADHLATRVPRGKIEMIPYGGDPVFDPDASPLDAFGLRRDGFFTLIARPEPENSVLEIVRAFSSRLRTTKLVVLGNYSETVRYQATVLATAGGDVMFPGAIYDKRVLAALRFYSVAYLHGHRVGGTNPSLVEALGAGNAVIAHDNAFNRWVIGNGGMFFADEAACADHISALEGDAGLRNRLRGAARARWQDAFRWELILDRYARVLEASAASGQLG